MCCTFFSMLSWSGFWFCCAPCRSGPLEEWGNTKHMEGGTALFQWSTPTSHVLINEQGVGPLSRQDKTPIVAELICLLKACEPLLLLPSKTELVLVCFVRWWRGCPCLKSVMVNRRLHCTYNSKTIVNNTFCHLYFCHFTRLVWETFGIHLRALICSLVFPIEHTWAFSKVLFFIDVRL
jgi:hypothetical protein